ncbi:putative peroxidase 21-like [Capsicum annuum]|nr:putative peroxidase 21-like [Capsicum annuum]
MAEIYSLLGVMDRLWFHQIILFSETPSVSLPKNHENLLPVQDSLTCQELSSVESESTLLQCTVVGIVKLRLYCLSFKDVCEKEEDNEKSSSSPPKERPTRLNLVTTRNRSHSSSPATNHKRYSRIGRYLKDTGNAMSYKSLNELEFEEVKGFMDLGFIFRRGHISKNLVSVLPGLQKLEIVMSKDEDKICEESEAIHIDGIVAEVEEDDKREIVRPYLSEAWLIKRPDSPLLNMKIPRISAASDMKKHLRYWAKTVANVVLQES